MNITKILKKALEGSSALGYENTFKNSHNKKFNFINSLAIQSEVYK